MTAERIVLDVNGVTREVEVDPSTPFIYVLRNRLGLTGAKLGCGLEQCGACAVLVDGESTLACVAPVGAFAGRRVTTVEGLEADPTGRAVIDAFVAEGAAQCGYCTPGIAVALTALLGREPGAGDRAVRAALRPHICRCGSHARVLAAARRLTARGGG